MEKTIKLTTEEINNLMTFLNRVTITGIKEVSALNNLVVKICKEEPNVEYVK